MNKPVLLILAMLLIPITALADTPAGPDDWLMVDTTTTGTKVFARTMDINAGRPADRAARIWVKTDASRDKTVIFRESKVLYSVDCPAGEYTAVTYAFYLPDGSVRTNRAEANERSSFAVPGSIMSDIIQALCAAPSSSEE
jgi:hypothetical protein